MRCRKGGKTALFSSNVIDDEKGCFHFQSLNQLDSPLVLLACTGGLCEGRLNGLWNFGRFEIETGFRTWSATSSAVSDILFIVGSFPSCCAKKTKQIVIIVAMIKPIRTCILAIMMWEQH